MLQEHPADETDLQPGLLGRVELAEEQPGVLPQQPFTISQGRDGFKCVQPGAVFESGQTQVRECVVKLTPSAKPRTHKSSCPQG